MCLLRTGGEFRSRSLLFAAGIVDRLPQLPGIKQFYGTCIHLCPYCDGWESSGQRIGVFGRGNEGAELALQMLLWSSDTFLFTEGHPPADDLLSKLKARDVGVCEFAAGRVFR
jgi:thioredoxin reductase